MVGGHVSCLSIMLCLAFFPCLQTVALLSSVLNLSSFGSYSRVSTDLEVWEGLYVWDGTCHPHCARNAVVFSHLKCDHCLAMSVHTSFVVTAIFPGKPGLARIRMSAFWFVLELRVIEVAATGAINTRAKLQSHCYY